MTVLLFLLINNFSQKVFAQTSTQSGQTDITVKVSGTLLTVSGYISPYASVVLTINDAVITSVVADNLGNFSFNNINVPKATSTVCFTAEDFKQLGTSEACINITPVDSVATAHNIFLPPTLGVQRTDVYVGNSAVAFGYGMPGALVTVHINGDSGCVVTADTTGYYSCSIRISLSGSNELYSDATLQGKPSEQQLKKVLIQGISFTKPTPGPTIGVLLTPAPTLPGYSPLFNIPWWVWILLVLITVILIIIRLRKYAPEVGIPSIGIPGVPSLPNASSFAHFFDGLFKSRKLHHSWMKGVGY